jgi:ABC-type transport system involved in cytochrome c biogenesis permease subunit
VSKTVTKFLQPFASLKLTVMLLALSMVLIFAGTTVQSEMSVWDVQHRFFHAWITVIEWRLFFPLWRWGSKNIPGAMPFPGGYTLIVLLLINLLSAHAVRFKLNWKRSGILLIHGGLILLLVGEIITSQLAVESQMVLDIGGSANFTQDIREVELAVTDRSPADHDEVICIPESRLMQQGTVQHPKLPFAIQIDEYDPNSDLQGPVQAGAKKDARATAGLGREITVVPRAKFSGTEASETDAPSSYVTLLRSGQSLGTYLVSLYIDQPQVVNVDGKTYWIQLRFERYYKPYTVQLVNFTHDRYLGTDVPKNFSSDIRLIDPTRNVDRQVKIWMNHPLRYNSETFYQASFKPGDRTSILQIVHNPGWLIPYISCTMVGLGLLVHFGMHLMDFLRRRSKATRAIAAPKPSWIPAAAITGICAMYLLSLAQPVKLEGPFDLDEFSRLPVTYEGRTMPLDSLARNCLRIISGRSEVATDNGKVSAIQWLADVFAQPTKAGSYKIFRIDHPDILSLLGLGDAQKLQPTLSPLMRKFQDVLRTFGMLSPESLFSMDDLAPNLQKLQEQYALASAVPDKERDLYQKKIVELANHILLFNELASMESLYLSPPLNNPQWRTFGVAITAFEKQGEHDPGSESIEAMIQSYHDNQPDQFNQVANAYRSAIWQQLPQVAPKLDLEVLFNRAEPFVQCMALYVIVFVLAATSWLKWHGPLARAALWVLVLTLLFHTTGLVTRIYLQGRPPVTNLYSSAIFIAWAAVLFCVGLELLYRNGVACAAAAAIAFPSLLIAHYLAGDGDTMQMLRAVLDTNIWLATHVVVVTLGYTATFLSGFLAIAYIIGSAFFPKAMTSDVRKTLSRMVYGVVCFAMLFSFVGTILGGIWADQSWGRFWGWDPKENGAVLIVLWNAIILHARWGGLVKERGLMLLAVGGNIVTCWSWFGTNMLGIGLHSYGFIESAVFWIVLWVGIQLSIIALGLIAPGNAQLAIEPARPRAGPPG